MIQKDLYLTEPINFLKSVTIKLSYIAEMVRSTWIKPEYRNTLPEELNPYYRHLRGEYILKDGYSTYTPIEKSYDSDGNLITCILHEDIVYKNNDIYDIFDEMMYVNSYDTQETIEFTIENLDEHTKTKEWYQLPNQPTAKLVEKYKTQSDLIKNIIYPVDTVYTNCAKVYDEQGRWVASNKLIDTTIDYLVNVDNYTLLQYDDNLLETNEKRSIIEAINNFLDMFRERWSVKEFCFEPLYPLVMSDILWMQLYNCILTQRVCNIRTPSSHSYHIWESLKSNGLSDYRYTLSDNKSLFLYRNIYYLLKNQGTRHNFSVLIGSLLKDLGLQLNQKVIIQKTKEDTNVIDLDLLNEEDEYSIVAADSVGDKSIGYTCKASPMILSVPAGQDDVINQSYLFMRGTKSIDNLNSNFTTVVLNKASDITPEKTITEQYSKGVEETVEYIHGREKSEGLEYTNEQFYNRNANKYDKRFTYAQHTYNLTKLHEIGKSSKSTLLGAIVAQYLTDALYYRAALERLDFAVHISNGDDIDLWFLDGREAIALMEYCLLCEAHQNPEYPMDQVYIHNVYDAEKDEYPEVPETFIGPPVIPLVYEYKESEPAKEYKTADFIINTVDTEGNRSYPGFDSMPKHNETFLSVEDMEYALVEEANDYAVKYIDKNTNPSTLHTFAMDNVLNTRCANKVYSVRLLGTMTDPVTGKQVNRSYQDYFDEHTEIKSVFSKYLSEDNPENWEALFKLILDSLFGNLAELCPYADATVTTAVKNNIKQLFTEMCSYHINFINSDENSNEFVTTIPGFMNRMLEVGNYITLDYDTNFTPNTVVNLCVTDPYEIRKNKNGELITDIYIPIDRDEPIPSEWDALVPVPVWKAQDIVLDWTNCNEWKYLDTDVSTHHFGDITYCPLTAIIPSDCGYNVCTSHPFWNTDLIPLDTHDIYYRVNDTSLYSNYTVLQHARTLANAVTVNGIPVTISNISIDKEFQFLIDNNYCNKASDTSVIVNTEAQYDKIKTLIDYCVNKELSLQMSYNHNGSIFEINKYGKHYVGKSKKTNLSEKDVDELIDKYKLSLIYNGESKILAENKIKDIIENNSCKGNKIYYTRSGSGTIESPYKYIQHTSITIGEYIPENTYYELISKVIYDESSITKYTVRTQYELTLDIEFKANKNLSYCTVNQIGNYYYIYVCFDYIEENYPDQTDFNKYIDMDKCLLEIITDDVM